MIFSFHILSFTDLEMVLNSLLSLIIISPLDRISKLVTTFCESIVKAQLANERFGIVKLRVYVKIKIFFCDMIFVQKFK